MLLSNQTCIYMTHPLPKQYLVLQFINLYPKKAGFQYSEKGHFQVNLMVYQGIVQSNTHQRA